MRLDEYGVHGVQDIRNIMRFGQKNTAMRALDKELSRNVMVYDDSYDWVFLKVFEIIFISVNHVIEHELLVRRRC